MLAQQAVNTDVFKCWDKDGGGSVSRKEFRLWWPRIGYEAPMEALNELFDEFDVDGSGEIDEEEFKSAFELRGQLWIELDQQQQQHDENENIQLAITKLKKEIQKKETQLAIDKSSVQAVEDAQAETEEALAGLDAEVARLNEELAVHQARLDAFKGGIKAVMKKTAIVNAFKSFATPDEAAVAIQSRVRGRAAKREVQDKIAASKLAAAAAPAPAEADVMADVTTFKDGNTLLLGSRR